MLEPFLSIVIPVYNEADRLGCSLRAVLTWARTKGFPVEVIVVDDGSTDSSVGIACGFAGVRVLVNERNRGKGFSVRRGVLEARGEIVLFTDADLSAPIEEADKLLAALEASDADVVVGSRALQRELIGVHQSPFREWGGRFFNLLVRVFTGLPIADTQCGFKLFRSETTRAAFELQRVERFGFDPEVLFLVQRMGGKVLELPVHWDHSPGTKVHYVRDSFSMVMDLLALRLRALTGQYPKPSIKNAESRRQKPVGTTP